MRKPPDPAYSLHTVHSNVHAETDKHMCNKISTVLLLSFALFISLMLQYLQSLLHVLALQNTTSVETGGVCLISRSYLSICGDIMERMVQFAALSLV